jgi:type II secretory pathway pseudopilin PulG
MKRPGFTLIETLITLGLSLFFIAGTGELLLRSIQLRQRSDGELVAVRTAASSLECLRALDFDDPGLAAGERQDWLQDGATALRFQRRIKVEDLTSDTKLVEVEIASDNNRVRAVCLMLLLRRELGF